MIIWVSAVTLGQWISARHLGTPLVLRWSPTVGDSAKRKQVSIAMGKNEAPRRAGKRSNEPVRTNDRIWETQPAIKEAQLPWPDLPTSWIPLSPAWAALRTGSSPIFQLNWKNKALKLTSNAHISSANKIDQISQSILPPPVPPRFGLLFYWYPFKGRWEKGTQGRTTSHQSTSSGGWVKPSTVSMPCWFILELRSHCLCRTWNAIAYWQKRIRRRITPNLLCIP